MAGTISLNGGDWQVKAFIGEDWLLRGAHKPGSNDSLGWVSAHVPGSIQNDLWQAGLVPNPYFELNSLALEWVPQRTWLYKRIFQADPAWQGRRVRLVFQGVDYAARYYLNGILLGRSQGLFLPATFEISEQMTYGQDNLLVVVVDPAPFEQPQIGYTSQVRTQKPRMNYWWDFCPRLIHVGIWEDVDLRVTGQAVISDLHIQASLSVDLVRAEVEVVLTLDKTLDGEGKVDLLLRRVGEPLGFDRREVPIATGQGNVTLKFRIDQPALWWPKGTGEQPLYEIEARVLVDGLESDTRRETFGIRRIEFTANPGSTEGAPAYNLVVNGRRIYINGWNWVPADVLYGSVQPEKYERLLRLAQKANVNLLRVWGGGLLEKRIFYDLCDRLGILIWQEFIQSSSGIDNVPPADAAYLQQLVEVAEQAIRERRNHPSLAVWCGGNELHVNGEQLCDSSHPALAALKSAVERLDPGRRWIPTSPAGGSFSFRVPDSPSAAERLQDVHGPWQYQGLREHYRLYNEGCSLLHSEFGVEGMTNRRALDAVISTERQLPISLENPVYAHLGLWWLRDQAWQEVFGPLEDGEIARRATQFLQAEGLRYAVEAGRRRQFGNGGTMPWQFNEPYPMAACTSAVDYFGEPKPVYYAVARAYRPLTVTARFDRLAWGEESEFKAEVWCSNAGTGFPGKVTARLLGIDGRLLVEQVFLAAVPENGSAQVGQAVFTLSQAAGEVFFLDLALYDAEDRLAAANRYPFSRTENLAPFLPLLMVETQVSIVETGQRADGWMTGRITVSNPAPMAAASTWLETGLPGWYYEDNGFILLPGETAELRVEWPGKNHKS